MPDILTLNLRKAGDLAIGRAVERFVNVQGLKTRYFEHGDGAPVLLLHGASLGSSADVWTATLPAFAGQGLRAIAFDQPGFGLTDNPQDYSVSFRNKFIVAFMDALRLDRVHIVGHSQSGRIAVAIAFAHPHRIAKIVALGTGSLLPPVPGQKKSNGEGDEGTAAEPTLADTRKLLEDNLYKHELITPAVLALRQRMSTGKNFEAFLARKQAPREKDTESKPLWQRLTETPVPLRLIYGKQDRGGAAERAALARALYPTLDVHVVDRCKHLVHWDAAEEFLALSGAFLASERR